MRELIDHGNAYQKPGLEKRFRETPEEKSPKKVTTATPESDESLSVQAEETAVRLICFAERTAKLESKGIGRLR